MKNSNILFAIFLGFLPNNQNFAVTCPDPEKVSGSLDQFDLSKKETSSFIDEGRGQVDEFTEYPEGEPYSPTGLKFQVRPNCYSSDNLNLRGCPKNAFTKVTFSYAMLNKFRSGDKGTVWCFYKTPDNAMISLHIDAPSEGTYRIANPVGSGWISLGRMLYKCEATQVESCSFDFAEGKLPDALSL